MKETLVFNIQRYSLHDGGGIRTIIFLKGCPLNCPWCSNPESQSFEAEILRKESLCIQCVSDNCFVCKALPEDCPTNALEVVGKQMSVDEIIKEVEKDMVFYDSSSGGVTISGGEPLAHKSFLIELLKRLKQLGIHTAIETSGLADWEFLSKASNYIDLFLFDLKIMDNKKSLKIINANANIIKNNFKKLVEMGNNVIPRIPLIPGFTMGEDNIEAITNLVVAQGLKEIHILPFHQYGSGKYKNLNQTYTLENLKPPEDFEVNRIKEFMNKKGLKVNVGGK